MNLLAPIVVALAVGSGCASLRPLTRAPVEATPVVESGVELRAVEGRTDGLVLRVAMDLPRVDQLELYRIVGEDEPQLLENIAVEPSLGAALSEGVELVDRTMRPGERHSYQMVALFEGAMVGESDVVNVTWQAAPGLPARVRATAPLPTVVELSWEGCPDCGAIIFRRNVLEDGPIVRYADVDAGREWLVDRDVLPGGVWSYRVGLSRTTDGVTQYGPLSEEVYASTPLDKP